jgi:ribosomal protein S24E
MMILKDFDNKLCSRGEYTIEIDHLNQTTPRKDEVKKKIAEYIKVNEDLIALKGTYTKYGFGKSLIRAYIYSDRESFNRFEVKNKKKNDKKEKGKEQKAE